MSKSTTQIPPRQRRAGSPRSRWTLWLSAAGVATLIVLVVVATQRGAEVPEQPPVAGSSDTGAPQKPAKHIQLSAAGGSEVGDQAPQFVATTTAGGRFQLSPGKPAVVFFMAPTCYSCLAEAQAVAQVHEEYGDRLKVLGVNLDRQTTPAQTQQFAQAARAKYAFTVDREATLVRAFDARALDTTVITDAQGRIVFRDAVATDEKTLRAALKKAGL